MIWNEWRVGEIVIAEYGVLACVESGHFLPRGDNHLFFSRDGGEKSGGRGGFR